jgi:hypothetical protein
MTLMTLRIRPVIAAAAVLVLCTAAAAATKPAKPAAKSAGKKPAALALPEAGPEQLDAARLVYYGHYECELKQAIDVTADDKHAGYVEVKHGKTLYLMKPVLSSTGAVRLEDVKGATLMVQIANKSMLLDVKAGHRIVDDCVSPKQRELIEAAARVKAAEAAASAASAAAVAASAAAEAASAAQAAASAASAAVPASAPSK